MPVDDGSDIQPPLAHGPGTDNVEPDPPTSDPTHQTNEPVEPVEPTVVLIDQKDPVTTDPDPRTSTETTLGPSNVTYTGQDIVSIDGLNFNIEAPSSLVVTTWDGQLYTMDTGSTPIDALTSGTLTAARQAYVTDLDISTGWSFNNSSESLIFDANLTTSITANTARELDEVVLILFESGSGDHPTVQAFGSGGALGNPTTPTAADWGDTGTTSFQRGGSGQNSVAVGLSLADLGVTVGQTVTKFVITTVNGWDPTEIMVDSDLKTNDNAPPPPTQPKPDQRQYIAPRVTGTKAGGGNKPAASVSREGLALSLRVDAVVTKADVVSQWTDGLRQNRHATQANVSARPKLVKIDGREAIQFDGKDDHLVVAHVNEMSFSAGDKYSMAVWVYTNELQGGWRSVMAKSRDKGNWYGIWIEPGNRWCFGTPADNLSAVPVVKGWHHVATVQDGKQRRLFVDGALVGTSRSVDCAGAGDLWIGGAKGVNEFFKGALGEVLIYRRALSHAEVARLAIVNQKKNDPVKPDPDKTDPDKPDPVKPDPAKPDPDKPDPDKPDPDKPNQPFVYFMNIGGENYKDKTGRVWHKGDVYRDAGHGWQGGNAAKVDNRNLVIGSAVKYLQAVRFTVPAGKYRVTLVICDHWADAPDHRTFDISVEGKRVLKGFDPFGAKRTKGYVFAETLRNLVPVVDGRLDIEFKGKAPIISGIGVEQVGFSRPKESPIAKGPDTKPNDPGDPIETPEDVERKRQEKREALATKALGAAKGLLETDALKGFESLEKLARLYRDTQAAIEAVRIIEAIKADPSRYRAIRNARKERDVRKELEICKQYIELKKLDLAYDALRKLVAEYRHTTVAAEAVQLRDDVKRRLNRRK